MCGHISSTGVPRAYRPDPTDYGHSHGLLHGPNVRRPRHVTHSAGGLGDTGRVSGYRPGGTCMAALVAGFGFAHQVGTGRAGRCTSSSGWPTAAQRRRTRSRAPHGPSLRQLVTDDPSLRPDWSALSSLERRAAWRLAGRAHLDDKCFKLSSLYAYRGQPRLAGRGAK